MSSQIAPAATELATQPYGCSESTGERSGPEEAPKGIRMLAKEDLGRTAAAIDLAAVAGLAAIAANPAAAENLSAEDLSKLSAEIDTLEKKVAKIHIPEIRSTNAEVWISRNVPWKCPVFKSEKSMLKWIEINGGCREFLTYVIGKINKSYYIAINKNSQGEWYQEVCELEFGNVPPNLWRNSSSAVVLKRKRQPGGEYPLVMCTPELFECQGMSKGETFDIERKTLEGRLRQIFGATPVMASRPISECEWWLDTGLCSGCCCYHLCCWHLCCDTF
jgi:hypothetical protein